MKKVTREEAIELLKPSGTKDQTYYEKKFDAACEIAVKDMEKQIPKKPLEKIDTYNYCPMCKSVLSANFYKAKYCHNCGQAIDWSDD